MINISEYKPLDKLVNILGKDFYKTEDHPYIIQRIQEGSCYEIYYALSNYYKPKKILEFGIANGWSVTAMVLGYPEIEYIEGYDSEIAPVSLKNANKHIDNLKSKGYCKDTQFNFIRQDTWNIKKIEGHFDLVHIDGDWIYTSVKHDLQRMK